MLTLKYQASKMRANSVDQSLGSEELIPSDAPLWYKFKYEDFGKITKLILNTHKGPQEHSKTRKT